MWCVTGGEFSDGYIRGEWIDLGCNDKSSAQNGDCEFSDEDTAIDLTPEREAEIIATLGNLLDDDLNYPVLWRLPDGTRVKI